MRTTEEKVAPEEGGEVGGRWGLVPPVRLLRALIRLVAVVVVAVAGISAVSVTTAYADDKEKVEQYNFYQLSSNVTAYLSTASQPDQGGLGDDWKTIGSKPSTGGDLLGYGDNNNSKLSGWLMSWATGSSNTIGYSALVYRDSEGNVNDNLAGSLHYAQFGSTLAALGLDNTETGLSLHFYPLVTGGILMLLYLLAALVDMVFNWTISILAELNPFRLFYTAISKTSVEMASGMTGGKKAPGWLEAFASWMSGWYSVLVSMSWAVVVPIFVAVFLGGVILWKKGSALSGLKKLFIRMAFLGFGLPLIGSMYTASLDAMKTAGGGASMGATQVILSNYVDFERWVTATRLYVPDDAVIGWDATRKTPTSDSVTSVRSTALAINASIRPSWRKVKQITASDAGTITDAAANDRSYSRGSYSSFRDTMDLLRRYTSSASIEASTFDTSVKGRITQYAGESEGIKKKAINWFKVNDKGEAGNDDVTISDNPILNVQGGGLSASDKRTDERKADVDKNVIAKALGSQGSEASSENSGEVYFFSASGTSKYCYDYPSVEPGGKDEGGPRSCNMSPLSTYNYLNSRFDADSVTTYSSTRSTSGATREVHSSVSAVGRGMMGFVYYTNSVILLVSFIIIGFGYALSMVISTIRNGVRLIVAIPFATLGAIAAIAKVIVYTFAMIIEVLMTAFVYRFVQQVLISFPSVMESTMYKLLSGKKGKVGVVYFLLNSGWISVAIAVISTILIIMITTMAMRVRGSLIKAVTEAATKIVEKFLDAPVMPPAGGQFMPALAGGIASGAAMSGANRLMSGGGPRMGKGKGTPGGGNGLSMTGGNGGAPSGGLNLSGTSDPKDPSDGGNGGALPEGGGNVGITSGDEHLQITDGSEKDGGGGTSAASDTSDKELASSVASRGGLSDPSAGGNDPGKGVTAGSDDAMSAMSSSMDESRASYAEADKARLGQGTEMVKAGAEGVKAGARAYSGDVQGAAQDAQKAAGHLDSARSKGAEAKAHEKAASTPGATSGQQQSRRPGTGTADTPGGVERHGPGRHASQGDKGTTRSRLASRGQQPGASGPAQQQGTGRRGAGDQTGQKPAPRSGGPSQAPQQQQAPAPRRAPSVQQRPGGSAGAQPRTTHQRQPRRFMPRRTQTPTQAPRASGPAPTASQQAPSVSSASRYQQRPSRSVPVGRPGGGGADKTRPGRLG